MATALPPQAPAVAAGGQDANSLQNAHGDLSVRGMKDTHAASDDHDTKRTINAGKAGETEDPMAAVLDVVSFKVIS